MQRKYDHFVKVIDETAKSKVGLVKKEGAKNWVSAQTIGILKESNKAKRKQDRDSRKISIELSNELLKSYERDKISFLEEKLA